MKKTKLLTSLAALALVLGLGGCNGETITVVSESSTEVLDFIAERGAAIDSWTGLEGHWDTRYDYYLDMSDYGLDSNWYDEYDSYSIVDLEQAVVKEGVLTGLFEETITDYTGDTIIGEYVEGDNYWLNYYGYVMTATAAEAGVTGLEYFSDDLVSLVEGEDSVVANFVSFDEALAAGDPTYEGFTISGTLEESSKGPHTATVRIDYDYDGTIYYYGSYNDSGFMEIVLEYDAEDQLTSFAYEYDDAVVWNDGEETDLLNQVITYVPFDGEVARPEWVTD